MNNLPLIFPLFGYEHFAHALHENGRGEVGDLSIHAFPDDEIVVRFNSEVKNREIILLGSLDRPNPKIAPLLFTAATAKALGAASVGLITPYLCYMRQDKQFHPGEGITSTFFANLISNHVDWITTVDPHLHRWHSLDDLYPIPSTVLHATDLIAAWVLNHIPDPILIGPDAESEQWVSAIATEAKAPFVVLNKVRKGDDEVVVSLPNMDAYHDLTPVIVDDIISTAHTMIETINHLQALQMKKPICIGVHALFTGDSYPALSAAGAGEIITCNTINHASNQIDVSPLLLSTLKAGWGTQY